MKSRAFGVMMLAGAASMATAGGVDFFQWEWMAGDSPVNNAAGTFESIISTYDPDTEVFTFSVMFSDQLADGFTLAVNDGPDPKRHSGELALVYFDATSLVSPVVTVYAYNGSDTQDAHMDGESDPGIQAPDRIASSLDGFAVTATAMDVGAGRRFDLSFDASGINDHIPMYPGPDGPSEWTGIGFAERLGIWFHPTTGLSTTYQDDYLDFWGGTRQGWLDGSNFETDEIPVPTPGALALFGLGGFIVSRRRR